MPESPLQLRFARTHLAAMAGLSIAYCLATFWYVATTPDIPVRCSLSEGPASGVIVRVAPEDRTVDFRGDHPINPGDELLALGGRPIRSFVDYAAAQAELRFRGLQAGARLAVGQSPNDLSPESLLRLVEVDSGERFVHIVTRASRSAQPTNGWLRLRPQPVGPLVWSFGWFLLQLPIIVLTTVAAWKRPDDRPVSVFLAMCCLAMMAYCGGNHWWVIAGAPWLVIPFVVAAVLLPGALLDFFLVFPMTRDVLQKRPALMRVVVYAVPVLVAGVDVVLIACGWLLSADWGENPLIDGAERWLGEGAARTMLLLHTSIRAYLGVAGLYFAGSLLVLRQSFTRARNPIERAQMQWIVRAGWGAAPLIAYTLWLAHAAPTEFAFGAARPPMTLAALLFMAAYAVGIARHKLMLFDQVLSRGMWYYGLTTMLAVGSGLSIAGLATAAARGVDATAAGLLPVVLLLAIVVQGLGWLRDRAQRSLDRRYFRDRYPLDRALQRINRAVTHVLERQAVSDHLLMSCCEALHVDRAVLYLQDGDRDGLRVATMIGRAEAPMQLKVPAEIREALAQETALQRAPGVESPVQDWLRSLQAELVQGLELDGEIIGLLAFGTRATGAAFTPEDVNFMTAIGRVTGVALHCAKVQEDLTRLNEDLQQRTQLLDNQRRRISFLEAQLTQLSEPAAPAEPQELRAHTIVGRSPAMRSVLDTVRKVAASEASVLVRGESGAGKELLARAIHENSPRRDGPLVSVHCAALSPSLLESELFGHVRGAFTDARETRIGRFQLASGGTLFLDEIGDISVETQVKLLRVLQERTIEPVGGSQSIEVDVRLIAATHQNLERLIAEGRFREDLYYRLNVITVTLPPLRERREDLFELAVHFLQRAAERTHKPVLTIDDEAVQILSRYSWPGNIRELQNVIERAVVLAEGPAITADDLPAELRYAVGRGGSGDSADVRRKSRGLPRVAAAARRVYVTGSDDERELLLDALRQASGNKADAARLLGIPRSTLFSRLKKLGVE